MPMLTIYSYGLPLYSPLEATLLQLAYNNQTGPNVAFPIDYDVGCPNVTALEDIGVTSGFI